MSLSVRARGNGRDDTATLQAALDLAIASGGVLELPDPLYLTGPLTVRRCEGMRTFSLLGAGSHLPLQVAGEAGTTLRYIGPPGGKLLHLYGLNSGKVGGFTLDGNNLAEPLWIEASVGVEFTSITAINAKGYGVTLMGSEAGVYRNSFTLIRTMDCDGGMRCCGTSQNANVASNSFVRTDLGFRGPDAGLRLESADNNDFFGMSIVGTGAGMLIALCPPTAACLGAVENRFHGLDGSNHQIVGEAWSNNRIYGLSHVNGIPAIVGTLRERVLIT